MSNCALHWFRRDLRLTDNTALRHALQRSRTVVPVYVVSSWKREHLWTGPARQQFLCGCLESLEQDLAAIGGRLIYRRGPPVEALRTLIRESGARALYYNRDPDPHGVGTERALAAMCRELGVACHGFPDALLHEPGEILTGAGAPYRVFTPFCRRWLQRDKAPPAGRPRRLSTPPDIRSDPRPTLATWGLPATSAALPAAGERAAAGRLRVAVVRRLPEYHLLRDHPAAEATSRLSQDLRFGTVSIRQLYRAAAEARATSPSANRHNAYQTFIKELAWREFYMHILAHFPHVLELEFNPDYRGLPWNEPGEEFDRWKSGLTGFPIVDAGMRELASTGFMHNRLRMIVAMFLTKDLHLDWRLGEQFFMQSLVDGEIASNNGGWQWSAGTGADAAPYFRIQNPWTQTARYDPDGTYIRKWVPELHNIPARSLRTPPPPGQSLAPRYPPPVVDHATERRHTLHLFKQHAAQRPR